MKILCVHWSICIGGYLMVVSDSVGTLTFFCMIFYGYRGAAGIYIHNLWLSEVLLV